MIQIIHWRQILILLLKIVILITVLFDINPYQFDVDCNDINESFEYSCDPMFYRIMNDPKFYEQDPKCVINEEYLSKTYNESEISNMYIQK